MIYLVNLGLIFICFLLLAYENIKYMKYKVTESENISTVFLDGEIDMDVADNVREVVFPLIDSGKEWFEIWVASRGENVP